MESYTEADRFKLGRSFIYRFACPCSFSLPGDTHRNVDDEFAIATKNQIHLAMRWFRVSVLVLREKLPTRSRAVRSPSSPVVGLNSI